MKIIIIVNGENSKVTSLPSIVSKADYIIAADGGIFNCLENNIEPDFIIGDLDSIKTEELSLNKKTEIIQIKEQNSTDLEKAIEYARKFNPSVIDIFCSFGKRMDHALGNVFILNNYSDLQINMHDSWGTMFAINPGIRVFSGLKGTTVSLFAFSQIEKLTLNGFEFPLEKETIGPSFLGVSNRIVKDKASIEFDKGRLLVYQIRDEGNK